MMANWKKRDEDVEANSVWIEDSEGEDMEETPQLEVDAKEKPDRFEKVYCSRLSIYD